MKKGQIPYLRLLQIFLLIDPQIVLLIALIFSLFLWFLFWGLDSGARSAVLLRIISSTACWCSLCLADSKFIPWSGSRCASKDRPMAIPRCRPGWDMRIGGLSAPSLWDNMVYLQLSVGKVRVWDNALVVSSSKSSPYTFLNLSCSQRGHSLRDTANKKPSLSIPRTGSLPSSSVRNLRCPQRYSVTAPRLLSRLSGGSSKGLGGGEMMTWSWSKSLCWHSPHSLLCLIHVVSGPAMHCPSFVVPSVSFLFLLTILD